jgi:hypothetical protein
LPFCDEQLSLSSAVVLSYSRYLLKSITLRNILRHKTLAFVALLIWLLLGWSGAHGHLCFDGQEPPMSVHMDMLGEHPEHHADEQHLDADMDLGQLALAKLVKFDLPVLLTTLFLFIVLFQQLTVFISTYSRHYTCRLIGLRPPLRAPPVLPA